VLARSQNLFSPSRGKISNHQRIVHTGGSFL